MNAHIPLSTNYIVLLIRKIAIIKKSCNLSPLQADIFDLPMLAKKLKTFHPHSPSDMSSSSSSAVSRETVVTLTLDTSGTNAHSDKTFGDISLKDFTRIE